MLDARELILSQGDEQVVLTRLPGARYGDYGTTQIIPHALDRKFESSQEFYTTERYSLVIKGNDTDDLAVQTDRVHEMLRQAWLYKNSDYVITPVYLTQRASCESNSRSAIVTGSPDVQVPNPIAYLPLEMARTIDPFDMSITRGPWQEGTPGELPTNPTTLSPTLGPPTPTLVHVSNHRDNTSVGTIFNYDNSLVAWSANLAGSAAFDIWSVAGSVPAAGDIHYIGFAGNRPSRTVVWTIGVAGVYNCDIVVEYYNGAWVALTYGDDYSLYPNGDEDSIFKSVSDWVLNTRDITDFTPVAVNGVNTRWIRLRIVSKVSWTTTPENTTYNLYTQRRPEVIIPATAIGGSIPPFTLMRMRSPDGGDDNPRFSNIDRIIVGLKTRGLDYFESHLNAGGAALPDGWATTPGTDASENSVWYGPNSRLLQVDFATTTPMTTRQTFTGTDRLEYWKGKYKVFIRAEQVGGADGDINLRFRTLLHSGGDTAIRFNSEVISMQTHDDGPEVIDMIPDGVLSIPFVDERAADDFSNEDILFRILAARTAGSSTLNIWDLILIPADEWIAEYDDLIQDLTAGSEALRGLQLIEDDGGVIENRTVKRFSRSGQDDLWLAQKWARGGPRPKLRIGTKASLFFLMMHYPSSGWGDPPFIGSLGMHVAFEMYHRNAYAYLRGSG
jgi:hypothetical protein